MDLKLNSRVEVEVGGETHHSLVEDIKEQEIVLSLIHRQQKPLVMEAGTDLNVVYAVDEVAYKFSSQVLREDLNGQVPLLIIKRPERIERHQRRNWVRMRTTLTVHCAAARLLQPEEEATLLTGKILDLSGGGILLEVETDCRPGDQLLLTIHLPDGEMKCLGEVRRILGKDGSHAYGIQFLLIGEKDRDRIVRYIFQMQRNLRQKGLL